MFRVYSGFVDTANTGTSRMGDILIAPALLVMAFGKPGESDQFKISGEYTFHDEDAGVVFTLYDWKSTSLYENNYMSPETLWASTEPIHMNIGGNHRGDVEAFKRMLLDHVKWVQVDRPFEREVIGTVDDEHNQFLLSEPVVKP